MKIIQFYAAVKKLFGEVNWQKETWGKNKKNVDPVKNRLEVMQKHLDAAKEASAKGDDATALAETRILSAIGFQLLMRKDAPQRQ